MGVKEIIKILYLIHRSKAFGVDLYRYDLTNKIWMYRGRIAHNWVRSQFNVK